MRHHERERRRLGRAHVKEVDAETVDFGAMLAEAVEHRLAAPPVIAVPPTVGEGPHFGERRPLAGVVDRLRIGPARASEPIAQIVEFALGDVQVERFDDGGHQGILNYGLAPAVA